MSDPMSPEAAARASGLAEVALDTVVAAARELISAHDLVIVEVRGDNHVRGGEQRYQNHYIMFLYFRDGLVHRWREFSNPDVSRTAVSA